jgi:glutamate-1-semialdehyde aminotransferase/spore coat polysaccharide biosynthesis protein SpsF (cytidylyltransferase family)
MTSTRLPGKVLADLGGRPLVAWTLEAARKAATIDAIWLATSDLASDDPLAAWAESGGWPVFRGSEGDVLGRYMGAAEASGADVVVRLTADCPFLAPDVIDAVVGLLAESGADYASNTRVRRFPTGLDVEAFTRAALERADREAHEPFLREHVTPYLHGLRKAAFPWGGFAIASLEHPHDFSHLRFTVDEADDLAFAQAIVAELGTHFAWMDAVALLTRKPELLRINRGHAANEGSAGQIAERTGRDFHRSADALHRRREIISAPPADGPVLARARGARAWDIDGNPHIDYLMGSGSVILGHGDPDVDAAIRDAVDAGRLSASPDLEESLAERLLRLIPATERVRFCGSEADALAAALHLARARTGRARVLLQGRDGALPPGDAGALERALTADPGGIAAVLMDMSETMPAGFAARVRELTQHAGAILIFDETSSAFHDALGGAQQRLGVTPDLCVLGAAMGNGMAIAALMGHASIMEAGARLPSRASFCDRPSLAAAIATIDKLQREDVPARLLRLGQRLRDAFNSAADEAGLGEVVRMAGEGWLPRIASGAAPVEQDLLVRLFRQEMAAHGLLIGSGLNLSLAHDSQAVERESEKAMRAALFALRDHLEAPDPAARVRRDIFAPTPSSA